MTVATRQRLLVIGQAGDAAEQLLSIVGQSVDITHSLPATSADRQGRSDGSGLAGVMVVGAGSQHADALHLCAAGLLDIVPDGIVLLDDRQCVLWHNQSFAAITGIAEVAAGKPLSDVLELGEAERTQLASLTTFGTRSGASRQFIRLPNRTWLSLRAARSSTTTLDGRVVAFVVTVRDVTTEILERQKQEAIYKAGLELGNLTPEELTGMSHEDGWRC